jgi:hypothetical protein
MALIACCSVGEEKEEIVGTTCCSTNETDELHIPCCSAPGVTLNELPEQPAADPGPFKDAKALTIPSKPLPTAIAATKPGDPSRFGGAWEELKAQEGVHIIEDRKLKWSNSSETSLTFVGAEMKMVFNGAELTAQVNRTGDRLQWSDGDVWGRATLNGSWRERATGFIHTISGASLSTPLKSGALRTESLALLSTTSFCISFSDDETHTATLDKTAMALHWSNGEVWCRTQAQYVL